MKESMDAFMLKNIEHIPLTLSARLGLSGVLKNTSRITDVKARKPDLRMLECIEGNSKW